MHTSNEREALIAQIRDFPQQLEQKIATLSDAQLDQQCGEGEWTVRQVVHHLADAHFNGYIRMKLILTEHKPILKPYDQEAWALLGDMGLSIQPSLSILRGLHERWSRLLEGLPESSWERRGVHLENGLVSLDDLLAVYVQHCKNHLDQISRVAP